jgi:hypothetical protein
VLPTGLPILVMLGRWETLLVTMAGETLLSVISAAIHLPAEPQELAAV